MTAILSGARQTKRRPAIVISTHNYHLARPDALLAIITSRVEDATTEFDCVLFDWEDAGLQLPSAMRSLGLCSCSSISWRVQPSRNQHPAQIDYALTIQIQSRDGRAARSCESDEGEFVF